MYELHPPHLINFAALPYESENTKNVIWQWEITVENGIKYVTALSECMHSDKAVTHLMHRGHHVP